MKCIGWLSVGNQFRVNMSSSFERVIEFFKHNYSCSFAHYEPSTIFIEWTTRVLRLVEFSRNNRTQSHRCVQCCRWNRIFCPARHHYFRFTELNVAKRISDCTRAGRTGSRRSARGTFQLELNAHIRSGHVRKNLKEREMIYCCETRSRIHCFHSRRRRRRRRITNDFSQAWNVWTHHTNINTRWFLEFFRSSE